MKGRKKADLTGKKFGRWEAVEPGDPTPSGAPRWLCRCDCGTSLLVITASLVGGVSTHCGCKQREEKEASLNETQRVCGSCTTLRSIEEFPFRNKKEGVRNTTCRICHSFYLKKHYKDNKDSYNQKAKEWVERNPEKKKQSALKSINKKLSTNPLFRLEMNLKSTFRKFLVLGYATNECFGGSREEILSHLEQTGKSLQDKGMCIDHIFPLSLCRSERELRALCHYKNTQLLTGKENSTKRDRVTEEGLRIFQDLVGYPFEREE
jgi:hypothetical protein